MWIHFLPTIYILNTLKYAVHCSMILRVNKRLNFQGWFIKCIKYITIFYNTMFNGDLYDLLSTNVSQKEIIFQIIFCWQQLSLNRLF